MQAKFVFKFRGSPDLGIVSEIDAVPSVGDHIAVRRDGEIVNTKVTTVQWVLDTDLYPNRNLHVNVFSDEV